MTEDVTLCVVEQTHVVDDEEHATRATNLQVVEAICDIVDELEPSNRKRRELITFVTDRPGHDARYAIDGERMARELGWTASVSLEDGLRRTVSWYLENEAWWRPLLARDGVGQRLGTGA